MAGVPQKQPATSQRPAKPPQLKFTPNVSAPQFQRPVQPVKPVPVDITKTEAYKRAKNRWTGIIVGAATSIYFTWVVYKRLYLEEGQKKVFRPLSEETRENKSANISD